ncbi:MAG: hypothetical protein ACOH2J_09010 [Allorhizobium sp.]
MSYSNLHVLVAEKQYLIAMEVERILIEDAGCTASICESNLEAELAAARYDVVILDVSTSIPHNRSLAQMIVETGADVIFLSSYEPDSEQNRALSDYRIVSKLFDSAAIMAALRNVTANKEVRGKAG